MRIHFFFPLFVCIIWAYTTGGCTKKDISQFEKENTAIEYNTKEFFQFTAKAKISLEEAWKIQVNTAIQKNDLHGSFYICLNDDYVFSAYHDKIGNVSLWGYYVNSQTGKVKYQDINIQYKLKKIKHNQNYEP